MQTNRIYSYDVIKFFAIVAVALLHFRWQSVPQAYIGVEFCFIITGFFIAKNFDKYSSGDLFPTLVSRIKTFYPYYVIASFILLLIRGYSFSNFLYLLTFFPYIGLASIPPHEWTLLWFFGAYTLSFAFYMCLLRIFTRERLTYIIGIFVFAMLLSMLKVSPAMSVNISIEKEFYVFFLPFGVARAMAEMGIGYIVGVCSDRYAANPFSKFSVVVEAFCLSYLVYIVFHSANPKFDILCCILISLLIFSLGYKNSVLSKFLEAIGEKYRKLFTLSMQIYAFHGLIIISAKDYLYRHFRINDNYIYIYIVYLLGVFVISAVMRFLYTNCAKVISNYINAQEKNVGIH